MKRGQITGYMQGALERAGDMVIGADRALAMECYAESEIGTKADPGLAMQLLNRVAYALCS